MKIPRYSGTDVNISSGRSLTTGIGSSQGLVDIGETALNAVTQYANAKTNYDAKMRRLEINTNVSLSNAQFGGSNQAYIDGLKSRDDYLTPDNWLNDYEKQFKKQELEYKKQLDEQTFKEFMPTFYENYFTTKSTIVNKIADQKVINAQIALHGEQDLFKSKIETATSLPAIKSAYTQHKDLTLKKGVTTELYNSETYRTLVDETKTYSNAKYIEFQLFNGASIITPDGDTEIDYKEAYERARDTKFSIVDIDGNVLTPDDDKRKEIIKTLKTLSDDQDKVIKSQKEEKDKVKKEEFTDVILGVMANDKTALNKSKTFYQDLANSDLETSDKITLRNAYETSLKNLSAGTNSYDSPQGVAAKSVMTTLVYSGVIDTKQEESIILKMMGDGLLKPEYATKLITDARTMAKDKNSYKKTLVKNATRMLMKEIGVPDKAAMFQKMENIPPEQVIPTIVGMLGTDNLSVEAYNAMNNLNELIAQGERAGFSYENMLANPRSENYILNDVITVYKPNIDQMKINNLKTKIDILDKQVGGKEFKTHYIVPSTYFNNKTPKGGNVVVPPRLENEDIQSYIQRLQKKGITKESSMPSTMTDVFLNDDDFGNIFITNE